MVPSLIGNHWGKARALPGARSAWHTIAHHGLDVAAAGNAYLSLRPEIVAILSARVGLVGATTKNWLLFALAVHDLSKFAACFRVK
jgi:CRISPR-associated endonuclease/helicase Cas3